MFVLLIVLVTKHIGANIPFLGPTIPVSEKEAKSNHYIEKSNGSQTLDWALEFKLSLGLAATATT